MAISFEFPELPSRQSPGTSNSLNNSGRRDGATGEQHTFASSDLLPNDELAHCVLPEALDALNVAVLVTDETRQLLLANNRAQQILATRNGLQRSVTGMLEASRTADRAPFEGLVNHASLLAHTVYARSKDATLAIQREPGRRPLTIVAQPLQKSNSQDRAVLIFALDPESSLGATEAELRELHGITVSEARLANLLMEGNTLEECCDLLDIEISTGRMHLGSLFAKTGTQRQSQLVSLLLSSLGAFSICSAEPSVSLAKPASSKSYPNKTTILFTAGLEAFDRLELGVVVTDDAWNLLFANRIANRLLQARDGLELTKQGTLRTLENVNTFKENRIAHRHLVQKGNGAARNALFSVARGGAKRPLTLMVRQIDRTESDRERPVFLILVLDPERPLRGAEQGLRQLYGLTPCEARLANLLMEGNALDSCCEQLDIRESTARMHLSNLFAKTGVQRQGQLISLLVKSLGILRYPNLSAQTV